MKTQINSKTKWVVIMLACLGSFILISSIKAGTDFAQDQWPQRFMVQEGNISVFQPQLDSYRGDKIKGRTALSIERKGVAEPIFGVVWFSARAITDRDARMVEFRDIQVERIKVPRSTSEQEKQWAVLLNKESGKWMPTGMAYDRLLALTAAVEKGKIEAGRLNTEPPKIIFTTTPSALILINGKPEFRKVENSAFQRVINTPFLILFDPSAKTYYTRGGDFWYSATNVAGPWKSLSDPPASVIEVASRIMEPQERPGKDQPKPNVAPRIIVATEPTELIVSDGQPKYAAVQGTELLYMSNTPSEVFMEVRRQQYYVLLAGRWYESRSLEKGPWTYVPSENLPEDFKRIPPGSSKGHILAFVAGTGEAEDAVLDAQIPQTKAIKRNEAKLSVTYDGDPRFEPVKNTDMQYAVNTKTQVIKVKDRYYAVDQAVWFVSDSPTGPWVVADSFPPEIETIPPDNPVYNVKYVRVYDSTPDVVYVGYTPGYFGSYVYGDTIVYGTGYYYPGWAGSVYYPAPLTWGFAPIYDPFYYSWGFGWGYGAGFVSGFFWGFPVGVAVSPWWYGCYWAGWYPRYGYGYGYGYPWRYGYGYPWHGWYAGYAGYAGYHRYPYQGYHNGAYGYSRGSYSQAGINRPINVRAPAQGLGQGAGREGTGSNSFRQGQNANQQSGQGMSRSGQTQYRTWNGNSNQNHDARTNGSNRASNFGHIPGGVSGQGNSGRGWTGGGYRSYGQAPSWGGGVRSSPGFGGFGGRAPMGGGFHGGGFSGGGFHGGGGSHGGGHR